MKNVTFPALAVIGFISCSIATTATADTIQFVSNNAASPNANSYGGFIGSLQYDFMGGSSAKMTLSITNTSQFDGKLVAIAFDSATGTSGWGFSPAMSSGLSASWGDIAGSISTAPFGTRSYGASTSSQWLGGGSPNNGLYSGDTGVWVFEGTGSASVSAADFLSPNSDYNLLIRFRGFSNGASDKLPATPPGDIVPGIAGLPVLVLAGLARRRRSRC